MGGLALTLTLTQPLTLTLAQACEPSVSAALAASRASSASRLARGRVRGRVRVRVRVSIRVRVRVRVALAPLPGRLVTQQRSSLLEHLLARGGLLACVCEVRLELCTAAALLVQQVLQHVQVLLLDLVGVITR